MRSTIVATCVTLVLAVASPTWADEKAPKNPEEFAKAMAEAGKPGPEHARLQALAGTWDYTCKFWLDPSQPPMESKGTIERRLILGGRFLEERVTGTNFDGKPGFEGLSLIGYDNGRKKYTSTWNCNMGTGTCLGLGSADESGSKLTFQTEAYCPLQKKTIKGREEIRVEGSDKVVAESFVTENGKEVKMMELVSVRKR
jgi:hypothetical protein